MKATASGQRRFRRASRGQALAEVAIALPILLALLVGIFEFARAYNTQQVITNAAREGARYGVLPTSSSAAAVQATVNTYLTSANLTADNISVTGLSSGTGGTVTVTVDLDYTFLFVGPVLRLLVPGSADPGTITLSSTSIMRKE